MSNIYIKDGENLLPINSEQLNIVEKIPTGVYTIGQSMRGYILVQTDDFTIPEKVYGETDRLASRILTTYKSRPESTGVLLMGKSGTGKTLLAKYISLLGAKEDIVTIIINEGYYGDDFNTFLQSIDQPAIVIFDEFEKVYSEREQERMLTLFDGVYCQNKLFILTCNHEGRINEHMFKRPGRVYYALTFTSITEEFARDYCNDNLLNKNHIESILELIEKYRVFTFDMLQAVVEEMNRYNETADQVSKMLNI